jgi:hypothetical protein
VSETGVTDFFLLPDAEHTGGVRENWQNMARKRTIGRHLKRTIHGDRTFPIARRTTATLAARNPAATGLIEYRRGSIRILDPEYLEAAACECCQTVRQLFANFYG